MTDYDDNPWNALRTPQVRDLAWACFSRPLIRCDALPASEQAVLNCPLTLTHERMEWLHHIDRNPLPLLDHLARGKGRRIGIYFERLWHYFLQQDPAVELIAHNLPVRSEGRTLGEFDCIYFCHQRGRHIHLELAVKFYLQAPDRNGAQWRDWLGPSSNDRLDLKLQHLLQHQLHLGEQEESTSVLRELGIEQLQREMEVKGRLFSSDAPPPVAPDGHAQGAYWHRYFRAQEAGRVLGNGKLSFRILSHEEWLAPQSFTPFACARGCDALFQDIQSRLAELGRPQLVALMDPQGQEQDRFFVVPDNWPLSGDA